MYHLSSRLSISTLALLLGLACSSGSSDSDDPGPKGGSAGSGSGGAGGSQSAGSGGAGAGAGGSSAGGASAAGSGGGGGAAGGAAGVGGAMGGSGGQAASPDAGSDPQNPPDAAPDAPAAVAALVGKMEKTLFKMTIANYDPNPRSGCNRDDPTFRDQKNEDTLKGDPNTTYDVTFRVRGLVEPKGYTGGMPDPANPWVNIGGMPSSNGAENLSNQYMKLRLEVSDPQQVYYLNRYHGDHTDHEVYVLDYKLTVKVKGNATMAAILLNENRCAIANHRSKVVEGIPAEVIMQPFKDQFAYIEVESVAPAP